MGNQLKECVRNLREESGFDDLSDHGSSFGSGKDLYNVFIRPFTDVVSTAAAETGKISAKAQSLAKVAFESLATTFIPFLSSDYDKIWADEAELIDNIKAKYKDVYDATYTAFKDNDIVAAAFGHSPAAFLTGKVLKKAPLPVLKTLNALSGGRMDSLVNRVAHALKGRDTKKPNDRDSGGQVVDWVRRAPRMQLAELKANDLVGLLDSPKVKQAIDDNPTVRQMQADSRKAVRGSLEKVYDRARAVKNAKSVEDLSKLTKGRVPALEQLKKLPEEERKGVEQGIVKAAKEAGIKVYVAGLTKRIQQAVKAGVPEDHPYVVDHTKALQKIKAL